eukprot:TRINITY_DN1609_c0_g3_i2.p1 TRINITY_DN1609_c0_g3~~TRINITY_DN1609_c0_g3_i2.p1  ORF type:complete len:1041 (-),score=250.21 TRINITY_DN1609_c0_g3_i2:78-3200(-)
MKRKRSIFTRVWDYIFEKGEFDIVDEENNQPVQPEQTNQHGLPDDYEPPSRLYKKRRLHRNEESHKQENDNTTVFDEDKTIVDKQKELRERGFLFSQPKSYSSPSVVSTTSHPGTTPIDVVRAFISKPSPAHRITPIGSYMPSSRLNSLRRSAKRKRSPPRYDYAEEHSRTLEPRSRKRRKSKRRPMRTPMDHRLQDHQNNTVGMLRSYMDEMPEHEEDARDQYDMEIAPPRRTPSSLSRASQQLRDSIEHFDGLPMKSNGKKSKKNKKKQNGKKSTRLIRKKKKKSKKVSDDDEDDEDDEIPTTSLADMTSSQSFRKTATPENNKPAPNSFKAPSMSRVGLPARMDDIDKNTDENKKSFGFAPASDENNGDASDSGAASPTMDVSSIGKVDADDSRISEPASSKKEVVAEPPSFLKEIGSTQGTTPQATTDSDTMFAWTAPTADGASAAPSTAPPQFAFQVDVNDTNDSKKDSETKDTEKPKADDAAASTAPTFGFDFVPTSDKKETKTDADSSKAIFPWKMPSDAVDFSGLSPSKSDTGNGKWTCACCEVENDDSATSCSSCLTSKPGNEQTTFGFTPIVTTDATKTETPTAESETKKPESVVNTTANDTEKESAATTKADTKTEAETKAEAETETKTETKTDGFTASWPNFDSTNQLKTPAPFFAVPGTAATDSVTGDSKKEEQLKKEEELKKKAEQAAKDAKEKQQKEQKDKGVKTESAPDIFPGLNSGTAPTKQADAFSTSSSAAAPSPFGMTFGADPPSSSTAVTTAPALGSSTDFFKSISSGGASTDPFGNSGSTAGAASNPMFAFTGPNSSSTPFGVPPSSGTGGSSAVSSALNDIYSFGSTGQSSQSSSGMTEDPMKPDTSTPFTTSTPQFQASAGGFGGSSPFASSTGSSSAAPDPFSKQNTITSIPNFSTNPNDPFAEQGVSSAGMPNTFGSFGGGFPGTTPATNSPFPFSSSTPQTPFSSEAGGSIMGGSSMGGGMGSMGGSSMGGSSMGGGGSGMGGGSSMAPSGGGSGFSIGTTQNRRIVRARRRR